MRTEDANDIELTLDDTQSLSGQSDYLEVETHNSDEIQVYVDDGTSGNTPAQYDLIIETRNERSVNDWMFDSEITDSTKRSYTTTAPSNKARIDITNTSGGNGENYRIYVESRITN